MILKFKTYFSHLNRNKLRGEVAPHKPVLLLAIIDYVEEKLLTEEGREHLNSLSPSDQNCKASLIIDGQSMYIQRYSNRRS